MSKWLLILLMLSAVWAQEEPVEEATEEVKKDDSVVEIEMPYTKQNLLVPRDLWRVINELLEKDELPEEVLQNYAIYPISITAQITPVDDQVTKQNKTYVVNYVEGGGELDLFNYVDGKGKFKLRIYPHIAGTEQKFHLLYVSESPGKLFGTTQWGNGCGNIFDLTESAMSFLGADGMLLTTAKRHYLHLMAGYFIIFQMIEDRLLLGYIRVKDSRYPQFSCTI